MKFVKVGQPTFFFFFSLLKGCFAMLNKIIVDALDSIICDGSYHFYSMSECCSGILGRKQNSANDYWILVSKIWNGNNLSFLSFFLLFFVCFVITCMLLLV